MFPSEQTIHTSELQQINQYYASYYTLLGTLLLVPHGLLTRLWRLTVLG